MYLQKLKDYDGSKLNPSETSLVRRILGKICWIVSTSRNTIVVVIGMILAYILETQGYNPFKLTGIHLII